MGNAWANVLIHGFGPAEEESDRMTEGIRLGTLDRQAGLEENRACPAL